MAYIKTQMDLLTKYLLAGGAKKVKAVGATSRQEDLDFIYDEEAKYLNNQRGFWTYGPGN